MLLQLVAIASLAFLPLVVNEIRDSKGSAFFYCLFSLRSLLAESPERDDIIRIVGGGGVATLEEARCAVRLSSDPAPLGALVHLNIMEHVSRASRRSDGTWHDVDICRGVAI